MDKIYQHYIIDLSSNNNFVQIPAVQGDGNNIRGFEVELIQNGMQYVISKDDCIISIMGTKPDTKQIMNECTLTDDGYILVDITSQMSAVKGRGDYQIVLFSKHTNSQLKSFPFYILTTPSAFDVNYIVSSDEFNILTNNITKTETVVNNANLAISDIRELEANVETAESVRINSEMERLEAEEARISAESTRKENEITRIQNETERQNSETRRINAENARISEEALRQENEITRVSNEKNRSEAEISRADAEEARSEAEANRISSENDRIASENGRDDAESARIAAENERLSAEDTRIANEASRQSEETARQVNENVRTENETIRNSNESVRQGNETVRENAEADRVSNEENRLSAEDTRIANENLRIENENKRKSAETTRELSETRRSESETTRISNETIRQENETIREQNEAERQKNTSTAILNAEEATERAINAAKECEDLSSGTGMVMQSEKGAANGVATLDSNRKLTTDQLPLATDTTLGAVITGSNITNTNGIISLTKENIIEALGFTPIKTDELTTEIVSITEPTIQNTGDFWMQEY